ncbi:hypothetical protein O7622_16000 [Micromonospora sp. WMMD1076]|uniref:hypothetical protein n=1 Tax=Micromonospora sp. WMMD1076 TaxID=3016103 RepID=UPI00249B445E|nr:hypothetical protein [Micromonospora sp. WMMD1076]WFF04587.1 hypothetical protein O7622_16000 [Micromonospora sp. WMMD1076]
MDSQPARGAAPGHGHHRRADGPADDSAERTGRSTVEQRSGLTRDLTGFELAEAFLLAAVIAVLAIRGFLAVSGYPQVSGSGLHISHMLWGGLGMLVALLLLLLFVGSRVRNAAAWIGGAGFGTFIDELGKFITQDTDYFFQPTIALIYAVLLAVFLSVRFLSQRRPPSRAEQLSYAYGALTDLAAGRLSERRRRQALDLLSGDDPPAPQVCALLDQAPEPAQPPSGWIRLTRSMDRALTRLRAVTAHPIVRRAVIGLFFVLATGIVAVLMTRIVRRGDATPPLNVETVGTIATVLGVGVCSLLGVAQLLCGARVTALRLFYRAALVALFIGQFVAFIAVQFFALISLAVNLLVLATLRTELAAETDDRR